MLKDEHKKRCSKGDSARKHARKPFKAATQQEDTSINLIEDSKKKSSSPTLRLLDTSQVSASQTPNTNANQIISQANNAFTPSAVSTILMKRTSSQISLDSSSQAVGVLRGTNLNNNSSQVGRHFGAGCSSRRNKKLLNLKGSMVQPNSTIQPHHNTTLGRKLSGRYEITASAPHLHNSQIAFETHTSQDGHSVSQSGLYQQEQSCGSLYDQLNLNEVNSSYQSCGSMS